MKNTPAECWPVGYYIREELEARGIAEDDFCHSTGLSAERVRRILDDEQAFLSFREAEILAHSLSVSPGLLLNIQLTYRKWRKKNL